MTGTDVTVCILTVVMIFDILSALSSLNSRLHNARLSPVVSAFHFPGSGMSLNEGFVLISLIMDHQRLLVFIDGHESYQAENRMEFNG